MNSLILILKSALNDFEHACTLIEANNCYIISGGLQNFNSMVNNTNNQLTYKQQEIDEILLLNLLRQFKNFYLPTLINESQKNNAGIQLNKNVSSGIDTEKKRVTWIGTSAYHLLYSCLHKTNKGLFTFLLQYFTNLLQKVYKYNKQPTERDKQFLLTLKKMTRFDISAESASTDDLLRTSSGKQHASNANGNLTVGNAATESASNKFQMNRQLQ